MNIEEFKAAANLAVSMTNKSREWQINIVAINDGAQYRSNECRAQQLLEDLTKASPYLLVHRIKNTYGTTCHIIPVSSIVSIRVDVR